MITDCELELIIQDQRQSKCVLLVFLDWLIQEIVFLVCFVCSFSLKVQHSYLFFRVFLTALLEGLLSRA